MNIFIIFVYSKTPYLRTLNFESQAGVGSYVMIMNQIESLRAFVTLLAPGPMAMVMCTCILV